MDGWIIVFLSFKTNKKTFLSGYQGSKKLDKRVLFIFTFNLLDLFFFSNFFLNLCNVFTVQWSYMTGPNWS